MCYKKKSSEGKQTQVLFQLRNPRAPTLPRVSQVWINAGANAAAAAPTSPQWP